MWKPVMDFWKGGYCAGFDRAKPYEFQRIGSDEVHTYVLAEQGDAYNVCNLLWREITP